MTAGSNSTTIATAASRLTSAASIATAAAAERPRVSSTSAAPTSGTHRITDSSGNPDSAISLRPLGQLIPT